MVEKNFNNMEIWKKLEDCLESAYNVISKRTGKMVDGVFVKDGK